MTGQALPFERPGRRRRPATVPARTRWIIGLGLLVLIADAGLLYRNLTKAMGG